VNRFHKWTLALGASLAILLGASAGPYEPYYLNGNTNLPMIGNTGGIYNDGNTGLFLNLSTMVIEDVFEDGLQAKVKVLDVKDGKTLSSGWIRLRYDVNGKAWALGQDKRWRSIPADADDPSQRAVSFIRQEMGNDARREALSGQIVKIMEAKKEKLGKVEPVNAISLVPEEVPAAPAVKKKGSVQKEEPSKSSAKDAVTEGSGQKKDLSAPAAPKEPEAEIMIISINETDTQEQVSRTGNSGEASPVEGNGDIPTENGAQTAETEPAPEEPAGDDGNGPAAEEQAGNGTEDSAPQEAQAGEASPAAENPPPEESSDVVITVTEEPQVKAENTPPSQTDVTVTIE